MTNPIGALFGRSPIRPIEGHMAKVESCVALLGEFLEVSLDGQWQQAEILQSQITQAEKDADEIKRDIRNHLPRSLFLPVARADVLDLVRIQDHLANQSREIANLILIRKMELPADLQQPMKDFLQSAIATTSRARAAINELDELLETGFKGREADYVEGLVAELDEMEEQSEASQTSLQKLVMLHEPSLGPVEVMFIHKLVDLIGGIAATAHQIGGCLLQLMAH